MAAYSYKLVCHRPELEPYIEAFEKKYGEEFDGDANYDGDCWIVASDYIDDLEDERDELVKALRAIHAEVHANGYPTACEETVYELTEAALSRYKDQTND